MSPQEPWSDEGLADGDSANAARLLAVLNPAGEGHIELRVISRAGPVRREFLPARDPNAAAALAVSLRSAGDVYFGVAPRAREAGTKDAIESLPALWADLDDDKALAALDEFALSPTALVASGRGHHAYWRLQEPVAPPRAESLMRRLAYALGGDQRATDAGRVLRVPGTLNAKSQPPAPVRLLELDAARVYSIEQLEAHLPDDPQAGVGDRRSPRRASPSAPVQRVLDRLDGVVESASGWRARCPAHDDHNPSLSVAEGDDGRALLHCFADCAPEEVVAALGLRMADLFPDGGRHGGSIASTLVDLLFDAGGELFRDPLGQSFAALPVEGHEEVWKLSSRSFSGWLRRELYRSHGQVAKAQAVADAVEILRAEAEFGDEERDVHVRVAGDHDRVLIDLADDRWRVVAITAEGWQVLERSPVAFTRRGATAALAEPVTGGSIDELREFVNFGSESDWLLLLAFLVMALTPTGPYPILVLYGESGSAKSTTARVLRRLVDPVRAPLRAGTPDERDLMVAASGSWLVGFDNMRRLSDRLSDALCQLATGAGFGTRQLYTDDEEVVFEAMRPALLNGIGHIAKLPDLISRVIALELRKLEEHEIVAESIFWRRFEEALPRIQGALFDLVAETLAELPDVELDASPRMADFARVGTALERARDLPDGAFLDALAGQRNTALEASLDADPVAAVLLEFMGSRADWSGSATSPN